jgi:hypothetical protein
VPAVEDSLDLSKYPSLAEPEETRVAVRGTSGSGASVRPRVKTPAPAEPPPEPTPPAVTAAPARPRELYVAVAGVVVLAGVVVALLLTR